MDGTPENSINLDAEGAMRKQISQAKGRGIKDIFFFVLSFSLE